MSLYDDVEANENIYEFIILHIMTFNDQDLEQMIHEANAFVNNSLCENAFVEILFDLSCEHRTSVSAEFDVVSAEFDIINADSDIILAESDDIILAEFDIILAESDDTILAESDTILAESIFAESILAESDIILAEFDIIIKEIDIIFEEVSTSLSSADENRATSEVSVLHEDSDSNFAEASSVTSQKKNSEVEILNNLALFIFISISTNISTFSSSTNSQMIKTARKTSIISIVKNNKKFRNKITKLLKINKFKFRVERTYIIFD
jgi:hypothetical protein